MIKNVLLVGLGGVGAVYASKIPNVKVLVDNERLLKYKSVPTIINNQEYHFDYVTVDENFVADLIIIATKFYNLNEVLSCIENFVDGNTIIISLLNGISSESIIKEKFPEASIVNSYLICNSIIRSGRNVIHDNVNKIVLEYNSSLVEFFENNNINYEISKNIKDSMWEKLMLNIIANQLSAVTKMSFGEMNSLPYIESLLNKILEEVVNIATLEGINNPKMLAQSAIKKFRNMASYGKTSMLQDIENGRRIEIDAFAGTIISYGKKYNVSTPYSNLFSFLLG